MITSQRFMTKLCFFLSFSDFASKIHNLLIVTKYQSSKITNRIQREFLFNNSILSHNTVPASSPPRQKNKPFQTNSSPPFLSKSVDRIQDFLDFPFLNSPFLAQRGKGLGDRGFL
jgi:hypothetical protein